LSAPKTGSVYSRRIPADPIEKVVLEMLRQMLLNRPGIADAVKRIVAEERAKCRDDEANPERLQKELKRKRKQLIAISEGISDEEDDPLSRKIAVLKGEIQSLQKQVADTKSTPPSAPSDVGTVADDMAKEFEDFGRKLDTSDIPHIKRLLDLLVHRMVADLETKQVEVEFAIPSWLARVLNRHGWVGLDECSVYKPFYEAHPENRVILGVFTCDREGKPVCYTCRRLRTAA
jgi:hypothetical protein